MYQAPQNVQALNLQVLKQTAYMYTINNSKAQS